MSGAGAIRKFVPGMLVFVLVGSLIGAPRPAPVQAQGARDAIEQLLPPGARQLLAVVRVFKGLSARNRVYREAKRVQRQLRSYYKVRIEKAKTAQAEAEQRGLSRFQIEAYARAAANLKAEQKAVIALTEKEKKVAKYRFEGRLRRELFRALLRTPKAQSALRSVRDTIGEIRQRVEQVKAALEGGNPIAAVVQDLKRQVDRLRAIGQIVSLVSGKAGSAILKKTKIAQRLIDDVSFANKKAIGVTVQLVGVLGNAEGAVVDQIETPRVPRAGMDVLIAFVEGRVSMPGGETPVEDLVSEVIARGLHKDAVLNAAVAAGGIDAATLRTMGQRVRAQLLADKVEGLRQTCGRATGVLRTSLVPALTGVGEAPEVVPCSLFRNPERLQAFILKMSGASTDPTGGNVDISILETLDADRRAASRRIRLDPAASGFDVTDQGSVARLSRGPDGYRLELALAMRIDRNEPPSTTTTPSGTEINVPGVQCTWTDERRFTGTAPLESAQLETWRFVGSSRHQIGVERGDCWSPSLLEFEGPYSATFDGSSLSGNYEGHRWEVPIDSLLKAGDFDGTYVGSELIPDPSQVLAHVISEVGVRIGGDVLEGSVVVRSIVLDSGGTEDQPFTRTQDAVQTIRFKGLVDATGDFVADGTTAVAYTLIACEPADGVCRGLGTTPTVEGGVAVSITGSIFDGTLNGDIVNSVSGAKQTFVAQREERGAPR